ncbi:hypothetical protein F8M49_21160 [Rhodococcus zopfii]|uniref:Uncharacterized protein n=1 Tax=Rhodococcus zopfii TaxID=43772 RepID=A0ABU3WTB2_9NOCA|nr:hypothetical protein [Rhodococcus zopfii]MDV2477230.1 hypothetical protein [Rhodococcus zopfii]
MRHTDGRARGDVVLRLAGRRLRRLPVPEGGAAMKKRSSEHIAESATFGDIRPVEWTITPARRTVAAHARGRCGPCYLQSRDAV